VKKYSEHGENDKEMSTLNKEVGINNELGLENKRSNVIKIKKINI
jgi:hypothetical protein